MSSELTELLVAYANVRSASHIAPSPEMVAELANLEFDEARQRASHMRKATSERPHPDRIRLGMRLDEYLLDANAPSVRLADFRLRRVSSGKEVRLRVGTWHRNRSDRSERRREISTTRRLSVFYRSERPFRFRLWYVASNHLWLPLPRRDDKLGIPWEQPSVFADLEVLGVEDVR